MTKNLRKKPNVWWQKVRKTSSVMKNRKKQEWYKKKKRPSVSTNNKKQEFNDENDKNIKPRLWKK